MLARSTMHGYLACISLAWLGFAAQPCNAQAPNQLAPNTEIAETPPREPQSFPDFEPDWGGPVYVAGAGQPENKPVQPNLGNVFDVRPADPLTPAYVAPAPSVDDVFESPLNTAEDETATAPTPTTTPQDSDSANQSSDLGQVFDTNGGAPNVNQGGQNNPAELIFNPQPTHLQEDLSGSPIVESPPYVQPAPTVVEPEFEPILGPINDDRSLDLKPSQVEPLPEATVEPMESTVAPILEPTVESLPAVESPLTISSPMGNMDDETMSAPVETDRPNLKPIPAKEKEEAPAWWDTMVSEPLRQTAQPAHLTIGRLVYSALQSSARVRVLSESPLIRETAVIEADANFDWGVFLETAWNDVNDPVGSTLTTGGPPRFQDEQLTYDYGLTRRNRVGGEFSASQQYGWQQSNSVFFIPNNQGTARLTLNYTQPLMRGSGLLYNTSTVVVAQLNAAAARDEFSRELQTYLTEVTQAYWQLYFERGRLLQQQRLYKRGDAILKRLEVRKELDATPNQIVRARAAVSSRRSDLFRAATAVKNAEGRIRALVNSPDLGVLDEFELIPMDPPAFDPITVTMHDAIEAAVRHRPELHQAMKDIRAASVRLNVSRNELLPVLDFVINSYVSGLRGDASIGRAFTDQFNAGSPSYSTGLRFEYPLGNRAARARNKRRQLELRQLQHQFRNTLHILQLEVETAMRETETTFQEITAKRLAVEAAHGEVELLTDRWKTLPGDDRSAALLLEDLLSAQERMNGRERELLRAQVDYSVSLVELKRSTGTLLQFENVNVTRSEVNGVPELHIGTVERVSFGQPVQYQLPNQSHSVRSTTPVPSTTPQPPAKGATAPTEWGAPVNALAPKGGAPVNYGSPVPNRAINFR